MKYGTMPKIIGMFCGWGTKKNFSDKKVRKEVRQEYRRILERAKDIGQQNRLLSSYALAAYFIALTRKTGLEPLQISEMMERQMRRSKLFRAFMGSSKSYFSEKSMESRRKWSKETYEKKYENDWVVDVLEKSDGYTFGFDYRECGVCKLCRDEGCPELAKYLCRLDYAITDIMGIRLTRTKTLAEGGDCCDFRFHEK